MDPQLYSWTCSVASTCWVLQSTGVAYADLDQYTARDAMVTELGWYPGCVNETYGLMSSTCVVDAFAHYGLNSRQSWVTFDQAYAICSETTGVINPVGMYHFMAIRDALDGLIEVANSAPGYLGVHSTLGRNQFNAYSPVQVVVLVP